MTLHDADVVTSVRTVTAVDNDSGQVVHPVRITCIVRLQWSIINTDVILSKSLIIIYIDVTYIQGMHSFVNPRRRGCLGYRVYQRSLTCLHLFIYACFY